MTDSTSDATFSALPREATLASRVAAQLEEQILSNKLAPSAKLPPERELARQFGVSRTVIREAVTALTAKSWLEAVPGGGARVKLPEIAAISQSMTLLLRAGDAQIPHGHILEVRRMLEIEIAGLAAQRREKDDLERLETILERMKPLVGTRDETQLEAIMRNDVEFHAALAAATHNPLFGVLLDSVADILLAVRRLGMRHVQSHHNALHFHALILEKVRKGQPKAARDAMRAHLEESEETMKRAALQLEKAV